MNIQISGNDDIRIIKHGGQWIIFVRYRFIPNNNFLYGVLTSMVTMS